MIGEDGPELEQEVDAKARIVVFILVGFDLFQPYSVELLDAYKNVLLIVHRYYSS